MRALRTCVSTPRSPATAGRPACVHPSRAPERRSPARSEDRGAHAHLRGSFRDRHFEIGGHAHRQRVHGETRGAHRLEARAQRAELGALPLHDLRWAPGCPSRRATAGWAVRPPPAPAPATRPARRRSSWPRRSRSPARTRASGAMPAGRCSDRRCAIFSRSTLSTQSKAAATCAVLLLWSGPMRCHCASPRSRSDSRLAAPSCT